MLGARRATRSSKRCRTCQPKPAEMERDPCVQSRSRSGCRAVKRQRSTPRPASPARPAREPRAVLAARHRQRLRRRDGRHGAQHPSADRRAGISPRGRYSGAVVHRRLRRHQGAHELLRRPALRSFRAQARAGRRLARRRRRCRFCSMWAPTWNWVLVGERLARRSARGSPGRRR